VNRMTWILFLDLETSGLNPESEIPLEYGAVLVDSRLEPVLERSRLICYGQDTLTELMRESHPTVVSMHTKNGLWADLWAASADQQIPSVRLESLEDDLATLLDACPNPKQTILGGFSPHFDRRWLESYAPSFLSRMSHRNLDVSTLRQAVSQRYHGCVEPDLGPVPHRGLGDSHRALLYYRWFLDCAMVPS
jgi:oligoribonuclease